MANVESSYKGCWWTMLMGIVMAAVVAMMMLTSCTTTKIVEVERVRTDTTYITKMQRDSVWLHDSIRVVEHGESIFIERWHTKYVERLRIDTLYQAKTDSVPVPYPVERLVEKPLHWWQKALMWMGGLLIVIFCIWVWRTK